MTPRMIATPIAVTTLTHSPQNQGVKHLSAPSSAGVGAATPVLAEEVLSLRIGLELLGTTRAE